MSPPATTTQTGGSISLPTAPGKTLSTSAASLPVSSRRVNGNGLDVWTLFNQLTQRYGAVNLGQGFMGFPAPQFVKEAGREAVMDESTTQYAPPRGKPELRNELAKRYSEAFGRTINPETEIVVTAGGNEGLLCTFAAFLNPGDEAILMEPAFDQYIMNLKMVEGVPKFVPLTVRAGVDPTQGVISADDWELNIDALRAQITPRTRIIVLNTPHNPVGKVFTREELEAVAAIAQEHNLVVLSDEVYDRLTYEGRPHLSIATLPGMWERTVVACSAGKAFGVTGWRIGWTVGAEALMTACLRAHTSYVFTVNSPMQVAIANAFKVAHATGFFERQRDEYLARRGRLTRALDAAGLSYTMPHGSYFVLVNAHNVRIPDGYQYPPEVADKDACYKMCYFFTREIGVTGIPPSEFYSTPNAHLAQNLIRFAFCKPDDVLDEVARRLQRVKAFTKSDA
ncbi:arylformamidase [Tieghemiomyces parasiticus]|uniref:Arylformamidase n=1 Tax=Tieghemiomyces parasiticus TaxID=78921 RepID=A0A9W8ADZ9_9FUNG|nr:arylformamidase [Tieghemiomyces parasiticus]